MTERRATRRGNPVFLAQIRQWDRKSGMSDVLVGILRERLEREVASYDWEVGVVRSLYVPAGLAELGGLLQKAAADILREELSGAYADRYHAVLGKADRDARLRWRQEQPEPAPEPAHPPVEAAPEAP